MAICGGSTSDVSGALCPRSKVITRQDKRIEFDAQIG